MTIELVIFFSLIIFVLITLVWVFAEEIEEYFYKLFSAFQKGRKEGKK